MLSASIVLETPEFNTLVIVLLPFAVTKHITDWDEEWKTVSKEIITNIWNEYYKPTISVRNLVTLEEEAEDRDAGEFHDIDNYGTSPATSTLSSGNVLQDYLNEPPVSTCKDPLGHWNLMLDKLDPKSKKIKITGISALACMGLDFLSAPAVPTDVERIFLHGSLTVSKRHHGLSDESIRACTVLNSWGKCAGLLPDDELAEIFSNKARHKRDKVTE
ncbi:uncharacterized protein ARMOST_20431 [Armillaria ostoyae]|uniref:HAT C-terminal dimerisation domain-containing protein n=1 Tax=Armillaria ostoyae TaxID=47428 RepID=A0A284S7B9_ARMOS|nr:uncharacterized protein ARMOST_20431 [Armillaria ostoyae]